jgi:hypothetical protein
VSDSKHTPGPWEYHFVRKVWAVICPSGGPIVYTTGSINPGSKDQKVEDEANARLIAAAPELLDALKHIARSWPDDFAAKYARAAIAIAKVEGRDG